jgi:hypothetical protein
MLTNTRFLTGLVVGILAVWLWQRYQARKSS